jgi:hypothetical protein
MLVNSQLAAQGVPTNEPFQTRDAGYQGQGGNAAEPFQSGALQGQGPVGTEPFQMSQEQAIPNATDYMKKVFRGVFH